MNVESDLTEGLKIAAIWNDEDLVELETEVDYRGFRGRSTCYTTPQDLTDFAAAVLRFDNGSQPEAKFDAAFGDGSKALHVRLYRYDLVGHIAAHVRIATENRGGTSGRAEQVWRLELEIKTESASLLRFARDVQRLAQRRSGDASLFGVS